jgi:hypothetical protein
MLPEILGILNHFFTHVRFLLLKGLTLILTAMEFKEPHFEKRK